MPLPHARPYFTPKVDTPQDPALREVDALARGELWTRQGLIRQAGYLGEYTKDPKRQAAWLVGLAGCVANDDSTRWLMAQAIEQGLPLEDAAHMAVFSDSRAAAVALAQMGVDWTTQLILPYQDKLAGPSLQLEQPVEVFMEHAIDPARARGYDTIIRPMAALDVALLITQSDKRTSGFLQGVVDAGVDPQALVPTHALGLANSQAMLLSLAIANRAWPLVKQWMQQPLSQDTLDEALLACAMVHKSIKDDAFHDRLEWEFVAGDLRQRGANPDAVFDFRQEAGEALHGYVGRFGQKRAGTARQWFLDSMLHIPEVDSFKWQPWFCPLPLPKHTDPEFPNSREYWCEWISDAHRRNGTFAPDHGPVEAFTRFFLQHQPPSPKDTRAILEVAAENAANGKGELLDAMLATPSLQLQGTYDRVQFTQILRDVLGLGESDQWPDAIHLQAIGRLWRHPRLQALGRLLPEDDEAHFTSQLATFRATLDELWPEAQPPMDLMSPAPNRRTPTDQDMEALGLALAASMAGFEQGLAPARRVRRTL